MENKVETTIIVSKDTSTAEPARPRPQPSPPHQRRHPRRREPRIPENPSLFLRGGADASGAQVLHCSVRLFQPRIQGPHLIFRVFACFGFRVYAFLCLWFRLRGFGIWTGGLVFSQETSSHCSSSSIVLPVASKK